MRVAPASSEFSSSSLATEAGRSTTSPAAIWLATFSERMWILPMVVASGDSKSVSQMTGSVSKARTVEVGGKLSSLAALRMTLLVLGVELDRYRGFNRGRFAPGTIGTEAPPAGRVHRGRDQRIGAADGMKVYHCAVSRDDRVEHDNALEIGPA